MEARAPKSMSRSIFIESLVGNIKEKYFFEKKLGSGGYGAVYLAKNKKSGMYYHQSIHVEFLNLIFISNIGEKVAIKAMQKSRISDYEAF
jgi:serine/threonine protein kinase